MLPSGFDRLDHGIQHAHRHRHVAGIGRDAGVAAADHAPAGANAADRRAARAGLALVAGHVGVVEIRAARALEQVARGRRLVAQLARGAGDDARGSARHSRAARAHRRRDRCCVTSAPIAQAAVVGRLDLVEPEVLHVDQMRRRLDLELHQVEQVGAAGDELGARRARRPLRRRRRASWRARR